MSENEERGHCVSKCSKHMNLYPDVYYYCTCGKSKDGVFCDGAHKGTSFTPKRFKISEPKSVAICLCRASDSKPYCDGNHRSL